ncbi:MAG: transcriptional regulator [Alphaproteobacteria bacterium PRO2]|nr:transcriptional regulator [Alphaproteobacteria bacterium PRO2]
MSSAKDDIETNVILPGLKAGSARQVLQLVAAEASLHVNADAEFLYDGLVRKEMHTPSGIGGGIAILHLQTPRLAKPFMMLARLHERIDFNAVDNEHVDLVVLLLSPEKDGPLHLCRLAHVSRVFKSERFCAELRGASDEDGIRALLMTPDEFQIAA